MGVLVYGFGPYREFRNNITEAIIKALPPLPELTTAVFPVRFNRRQFIDMLERHKPDHVLGLGQCIRHRIEFESRATNRKRVSNRVSVKPIRQSGAEFLSTNLDSDLGSDVGCGAHLTELRRTRSGRFTIAQAVPLDRVAPDTPLIRLAELTF